MLLKLLIDLIRSEDDFRSLVIEFSCKVFYKGSL
jgi:hypothetical protein